MGELEDDKPLDRNYLDPVTGLSLANDERLIRAREAMILAVQLFNSTTFKFKTEVFCVLANIAWTYLLHEYYKRHTNVDIIQESGRALLLSQMIKRPDGPLSRGIKNNLKAVQDIRDTVEHQLLGRTDVMWFSLFQACCLNFDKTMCKLFGDELTLAHELSFALQFSNMDFDQLIKLQEYDIPAHIKALDARLQDGMKEDDLSDREYQFRVIYTLDSASKSRAHIEFIKPGTDKGREIRNVLVKPRIADQLYPYKPGRVAELVSRRSNKKFNLRNHTQAWRLFEVRPLGSAKQPENTNKDFCIYHVAHGDYTYSEKWIDHLVDQWSDEEKRAAVLAIRIN